MEKSVASSVPKSEAKTSLRKSGASTTLSLVAEPEMIAEDDADDDAASTAVNEEEEEEEISGVSLWVKRSRSERRSTKTDSHERVIESNFSKLPAKTK